MKIQVVKKTSLAYTVKAGRRLFTLPRVSTILDWKYGKPKIDPEHLAFLGKFGTEMHRGLAGKRVRNEGVMPYVEQGFQFLAKHGVDARAIEFPIYNLDLGFAGTPDLKGMTKQWGSILLDWKSGAVSERHEVQVNLYDLGNYFTYGETMDKLAVIQLTAKAYKVRWVEKNWSQAAQIVRDFYKSQGGKK